MSRSRNWDRIKLYSEAKVEDIGTVVVNKVNHKVLRLLSQVCSQGTIASLNRIFSRRWMNVESGMKLFVSQRTVMALPLRWILQRSDQCTCLQLIP